MTTDEGIDLVADRIVDAAKILSKRGVSAQVLQQDLKMMGIQAFLTKTLTINQAEDAMAKVLTILGILEGVTDQNVSIPIA